MQQIDVVTSFKWRRTFHQTAATVLLVIICSPGITQEKEPALTPITESVQSLFKKEEYKAVIMKIASMAEEEMGAEMLYIKARALQEIGENKKAISAYDKAIRKSPNDPRLYSNRGLSIGSTGELKRAILDFNKAIELDKSFEQAYVNRGVAKGALKDWNGAINDFSTAIRINPNYAAAWRNRGILRETVGDLKAACLDWRKANELGQKDAGEWVRGQCE
jgi:tetratricopeptide (TPR) repeat protein